MAIWSLSDSAPVGGQLSRNPSSLMSPTNTFGRSRVTLRRGGKKFICPFFASNSFSTLNFAEVYFCLIIQTLIWTISSLSNVHFCRGRIWKNWNLNSVVNSTPRPTKLSQDMDPSDPYRMVTSFGHAHFRFRFPSRSKIFRFSRISPWRFAIFPKFHRRLVGLGGA